MFHFIQTHSLFGLSLTVVAYAVSELVWRRFHNAALLHPVLIATVLVAGFLLAADVSYGSYLSQVSLLHEMLAVVIVLLAVPLYRQIGLLKNVGSPIAIALLVGSIIAITTALALPATFDAPREILATLVPKSSTTAVAVEIADSLGGIAGLTAVIVISSGVVGAVFGPGILDLVGVTDERARGLALGVASHGIGTARAFQISEVTGAFSTLGMILNAILTIALAPFVLIIFEL